MTLDDRHSTDNHVYMVRKLELETGKLILSENEIERFLERTVTPIGMSGKADIPGRYIGR